VAHYKGEPAGVIICIPDLNPFQKATRGRMGPMTLFHFIMARLRRRRAVIIFYSVKRALQGQGLNGAMLHRVAKALFAGGYRQCGVHLDQRRERRIPASDGEAGRPAAAPAAVCSGKAIA
jgi:hypothetical protein